MASSLHKLIGQRIRAKRKQANFSQQELGTLVDYSDSAISAYETGDRSIPLEVAFNIAEALDCSVDDFNPNIQPFDY